MAHSIYRDSFARGNVVRETVPKKKSALVAHGVDSPRDSAMDGMTTKGNVILVCRINSSAHVVVSEHITVSHNLKPIR